MFLDLRSYLFGDVPLEASNDRDEAEMDGINIGQEAENILNNNHRIQNGLQEDGNILQQPEDDALNMLEEAVNHDAIDEREQVPPIAPPILAPAPMAEAVGAGGGGLGEVHQALFNQGPTGFQPYNKPSFFCIEDNRVVGTYAYVVAGIVSGSHASPCMAGKTSLFILVSGEFRSL